MPDSDMLDASDPLELFSPPVRAWFQATFGTPTPPQAQGWPPIQRGEHTLILAPTGSGKTLAAFLWGIDQLFRELTHFQGSEADGDGVTSGSWMRLVYISPLKALNNDIHRNLRVPLAGIRQVARSLGIDFPDIEVAVRSGDTPQRERRAMLSEPPHILITTPESLYLLLTSPKARDMFRTVRTVIVDEIHTLAGNKRGAHLAFSLERLRHMAAQPIQRIGLSATIQPLDEVARFLGGSELSAVSGQRSATPALASERTAEHGRAQPPFGIVSAGASVGGQTPTTQNSKLAPRPVTIVDAAYQKPLDLKVETLIGDFRQLPGDSIWPTIIPRLLELIRQHKTTLIFANNRRLAERTADRLNEQIAAEAAGKPSGLVEGGVVKGVGFMATGSGTHAGPIRVHHGSMSKESRLDMEHALKEGQLPALVGTSSLELGIDIGSVDLVIQLQSPKSVAQGLQRVGRSGHLVGQTSKGRFFPTHREDVMEAAAIAGGMLRGEVEPTHTPRNPLDVLAQQIVAMISVETWDMDALFDLAHCAYPFQDLTPRIFRAVVEMLAGRYPSQAHRELRPRLALDPVNSKLSALPGSRLLAMTNGGTIPDRGAFGAYLSDGKTKLGELDEEFVYETRVGDTLMLGSQPWRVVDITDDRVMLAEAAGAASRMPFWRGDYPWRPYELGRKVGAFRRAVAERVGHLRTVLALDELREIRDKYEEPEVQEILAWLRQDYALDENSAQQVVDYVASQLDLAGAIASDQTVLVEVFDDALGDPRMVIHSPFGGRVNGPWGLALAGALRERVGVDVELQTNDEGILLRFPEADAEFPLDLVSQLGPVEARERILRELPDSAVFGAQFRQNAARALLLPGLRGGKRTPFWLQRLRARDLLQVVRQFDDFPIVAETYRDCLQDVMDLPGLEDVLAGIQRGDIQVTVVESLTPSPVAESLLWNFINIYMYEGDVPKAERQIQTLSMNRDLLQDLLKDIALDELLRPEAVEGVESRLQHTAPTARARTADELAVMLQQMGDLSSVEIAARASIDPAGWIGQLAGAGRIVTLPIPTDQGAEQRWVAAEYEQDYRAAFGGEASSQAEEARRQILERFLSHAGSVTVTAIRRRYAFPADWLAAELDRLVAARQLAHGRFTPQASPSASPASDASSPRVEESKGGDEFIDRRTLEQMHRHTLTILRREVQPVPFTVYADFLARWQHLHPATRLTGRGALAQALQQLRATPVVGLVWERDVLPLRLVRYDPAELAALCQGGELVWVGSGGADPRRGRVRFLFRGEGSAYLEPALDDLSTLGEAAQAVYAFLKSEGAVFFADIRTNLDLDDAAAEAALIELAMAGLVTNDSLDAMRQMVKSAQPQGRGPFSSLEGQLAERMAGRTLGTRRPNRSQMQAAKRRVRERLEPESAPRWVGRWTLVHRQGVLGKPVSPEARSDQQARQLLARHGVVTHDSLAGEAGGWEWSPIYQQLQRLEMRGEVRRGYFVQGLPGIQFALPEVVERLRATRSGDQPAEEALVVMSACDPANLWGAPLEGGMTFPRIPSTWLVMQRGLPILVAEDTGANLTTIQGAGEDVIRRALVDLLGHLAGFEHRITVERWNGEPVLDSAGRLLLESAGFYRDYPGMTWERH